MKWKRDVGVFISVPDTSVNTVEPESKGSNVDLTQPQRDMPTSLTGVQSATETTGSQSRASCC